MPSRTFASNKSSLFADGSSNLGGGADQHMPVGGPYSGYTFRSAVRFALDFLGHETDRLGRNEPADELAGSRRVLVGPGHYVARCTADWTANSSSGSSDGGSGWGTSPTVYPGPASTTTNRVTRDISTSEGATVGIDITGIVRDWLNGQPNYGVLLYYVASGDVTEFNSYRAGSGKPEIVVTYATDSPPTATLDAPTGVQSTTRPTLSGTATDPDGDPITNVAVAVYRSSDNVLVYYADLGAVGSSWSHVPTADLPGGALWAAATPVAGGLTGAASNVVNFTVDRPPNAPVWSAPSGNVGGTRRPVHTFSATDPDGDALELYDLEVYQSVGGAPSGAAVYAVANLGASGTSVSHTPTIDLPGGPLLARSRVRTGPADLWSAWSAYQAYSIILTTPTVAWIEPASSNAFEVYDNGQFVDQWSSPLITAIWGRVQDAPPSGQTLTREARGYGYEAAGASWAYDGPPQAPNTPTGGTASQPIYASPGGGWMYGRGHFRFIIGSSGGGLVDTQRNWRASILEWYGAVFLGDNVTAIAATLAGMGGQLKGWWRAQASRTDSSKGWRELTDQAGILAELPATGAYLGLRSRFAINGPDVDLLGGAGSFEDPTLAGWTLGGGQIYVQGNLEGRPAPDGSTELRITGDGVTAYPQVSRLIPVVPGGAYYLEGYLQSAGGVKAEIDVRCDAIGPNLNQGFALRILRDAQGETAHTYQKVGPYVVPADGSVTDLQLLIYIAANPSIAGQDVRADAVKLVGPKAGAAGLDKWVIDWTSAG